MDHIFRCSVSSRQEWKAKWWEMVEVFHAEHGTHPLLRHVFREAVLQWFNPGLPVEVSSIVFPREVRLLIQQQNAIGWPQIFRGRFTSKWQKIQNVYYLRHEQKSAFKRTGEMWQKTFILVIWDTWFEL